MCIINNNNCGRLHDLTLRLKIPMSTLKNFFEIYRKFGHAPSKRFVNSVLAVTVIASSFNVQKFYIIFTMYMCVLCRIRNKQQHLPYSALTVWF